jgi:hypothetical protein
MHQKQPPAKVAFANRTLDKGLGFVWDFKVCWETKRTVSVRKMKTQTKFVLIKFLPLF